MSAAFVTTDHGLLLDRFETRFGVLPVLLNYGLVLPIDEITFFRLNKWNLCLYMTHVHVFEIVAQHMRLQIDSNSLQVDVSYIQLNAYIFTGT